MRIRWLALLGAGWLVGACLHSTPFKTKPSFEQSTKTELKRLRPQAADTDSFTFVAFGDTHDEYDDLERSVGFINRTPDVEFSLITGDLTDRGLLQEFEWSGELYRDLAAPFLTVIGNHDHLSDGREIYGKMYGALDYTFEYGGLKFVMFDSNSLESEKAPDRDFLREEVANLGKARGIVLVTHQDPTAPNDREDGSSREFYDELLQEPGIVLVVHGHLDAYRLRTKYGVPILQTGTYETQRTHTVVRVAGDQFSFTRCVFDECEEITPNVEAP